MGGHLSPWHLENRSRPNRGPGERIEKHVDLGGSPLGQVGGVPERARLPHEEDLVIIETPMGVCFKDDIIR
jgi:hypothetical protein